MPKNGNTSEKSSLNSGNLAFDLLEHHVAAETLLTFHTSISAALTQNPCAEIRALLEDTKRRLISTFDTMHQVLDAHEHSCQAPKQRETLRAWRTTIERLKRRVLVPHTTTVQVPIYAGWGERSLRKEETVYHVTLP